MHYSVVVQSFVCACMHDMHAFLSHVLVYLSLFVTTVDVIRFKFDLSLDEIKMHKGVESLPYYFLYRVGRS